MAAGGTMGGLKKTTGAWAWREVEVRFRAAWKAHLADFIKVHFLTFGQWKEL